MPSRVGYRDWPRLTRFYGISPRELAITPHAILSLYAEQLPVLAAEEALLGFTTASMPYAEEKEQKRVHRAFEQYIEKPEEPKLDVRTDAGAHKLAGMGIGVHIEQPPAPTEVKSPQEN